MWSVIENVTETDAVQALDRAPFLPDDRVDNRVIAILNERMAPADRFLAPAKAHIQKKQLWIQ